MHELFTSFMGFINLIYIIVCNTITYLSIRSIIYLRKGKGIKTWTKRAISTLIAIILGVVMIKVFNNPVEPIFYSFFIQFLTWDYVFKALVNRVVKEINGKK